MKINNKYIGVFDSGVGGLTVLQDLQIKFPNESFLYLGDTLRCPYGVKEKSELEKIVESDIDYFERHNVKMVVIACNTATANSYHIKKDFPIIRIIEPTCNRVKEIAKEKNIKLSEVAVLATNFTSKTHAYNKFLNNEAKEIQCSEWVDIIERSETNTETSKEAVERILAPIKGKVKIAILGCTHFGLLENEIKAYLGDVIIINSSTSLTDTVNNNLDIVGRSEGRINTVINVTGKVETLNCDWFRNNDGSKLDKSKINMVDIND